MRDLNEDPSKHFVFVYGTLKKGYSNHRLLAGANFVGNGVVFGYRLVRITSIPGAIPGPTLSSKIHGEVWEINAHQLDMCDQLEGHPHVYTRTPMHVHTDKGNVTAWGYVLSPAFTYRRTVTPIPGGRWPNPVPTEEQFDADQENQ